MFVDTSPPGQCIFCRLVQGSIPAARVYEDALTIAFILHGLRSAQRSDHVLSLMHWEERNLKHEKH